MKIFNIFDRIEKLTFSQQPGIPLQVVQRSRWQSCDLHYKGNKKASIKILGVNK